MSERIICHLDMNSYFASVEQQANLFLRGKPVAVCAYVHKNGNVIAPSIEAKKFGIKTGMRVQEAQKKAPETVLLESDASKYRTTTSRTFHIIDDYSDRIDHYSIDEVFLDLTGWRRDEAEATFVVSNIKWRISQEVGNWLRCSTGIVPTYFLAKYASDRQKPDGLTIITQKNLSSIC